MTFDPFQYSTLLAVLPEFLLVVLAALVLAVDLLRPEWRPRGLGLFTALGCGVIMVVTLIFAMPTDARLIFGGMIRHDALAFIFRELFLFAALITALISIDSHGIGQKGEYYAILLGATLGMNLMAASADLIMLYLAVETTSIGLYLLAGFVRDDSKSAESGLKYFLFGAFTSTVMLYGFSLLYGFTGQTNFYAIAQELSTGVASGRIPTGAVMLAALFILAGLGFKISAVPFHFWSPDVYEGAPSPVTGFISTASKAAGFAVLVRILITGVFPDPTMLNVREMLTILAAFTMTVGNLVAISQKNIKRLLAYSSVAQAGYILVGLAAFSTNGVAAAVFYLIIYTLTNLTAFGVIVLTARATGSDEIADYAGMSRRSPALALAFMVAFLSLGGMPPFAGFFGKFFLFAAAIEKGLYWLVVVGVLNAIVSIYYYLTVLKVVYLYRSEKDNEPIAIPRAYAFALFVCAIGVIVLGTWTGPWLTWSTNAAASLF